MLMLLPPSVDEEEVDAGGAVNQVFHMLTTFFFRSWAISAARSPFAWVKPRLLAIAGNPTAERLTLNRELTLEEAAGCSGGGEVLGVTEGSAVVEAVEVSDCTSSTACPCSGLSVEDEDKDKDFEEGANSVSTAATPSTMG